MFKKILHALVPAGAAAIAAVIPVFGAVPLAAAVKIAGAAFVGYLLKPARPADQPKP